MAKNFAEIAFTNVVKELQEKHGSRYTYERMEKLNIVNGLSENEILFIENSDSFYMASIGDNNYPYIQHRGGPKGFVKVIDKNTLGFIDFSGNKQYITVGNLVTNNNIALIMVNYPAKARLKIFAKAEVVELNDNPSLFKSLDLKAYKFKPERMMILHIEAYDWNCPQHITPRYTIEEIDKAFAGQTAYIAKLEAELKALKQKFSS
jgi:predicted pyridoxine 5'-phosphate oxidase superfamily flavin-nucleotide-binding protein